MIDATWRMRSAFATELPPNFMTIIVSDYTEAAGLLQAIFVFLCKFEYIYARILRSDVPHDSFHAGFEQELNGFEHSVFCVGIQRSG